MPETPSIPSNFTESVRAIVRVDGGRGFVVRDALDKAYVLTAAHCLPSLPACHGAAPAGELTYDNLLGRLDDSHLSIAVECVFVDPVADIAVLASPDNQALAEAAEVYKWPGCRCCRRQRWWFCVGGYGAPTGCLGPGP